MQRKIPGANKLQSGEMKEFQIDGISFLLIRHKENSTQPVINVLISDVNWQKEL